MSEGAFKYTDLLNQPIHVGDRLLYINGGNGTAIRHRVVRVAAFTEKRIKVVPRSTPLERLSAASAGYCETVTHKHVLVVNKLVEPNA